MKTTHALTLFTVALLGCGTGALGNSPTVSGQIQGWDGGTAQVQAIVGTVTSTGSVDAKGNFSVQLPAAAALAGSLSPNFPLDCSSGNASDGGLPQPSPSSTESAVATFAINGDPLTLGASNDMTSTGNYLLSVSYVFANQNATVSGSYSCDATAVNDPGAPATAKVSVSSGWNTLLTVTNTASSATVDNDYGVYETNGPIPSAAQWSITVPSN